MGFFRNFSRKIKSNLKNDVEDLRGKGADDKADLVYNRIKAFFSGGWNILIDKMVNLLLHSAKKDIECIIIECKAHGVDPYSKLPTNVREKLKYAR